MPVPSAGTDQTAPPYPYARVFVSVHSAWSSMPRRSATGCSRPVPRSRTYSRHGSRGPSDTRFLKAIRVPSGESEGHSTFSRRARADQFRMSPSTRRVRPPVETVA
ncbi:hypothetical protein STANM309S_02921 [Streptomyces tanashiensis]